MRGITLHRILSTIIQISEDSKKNYRKFRKNSKGFMLCSYVYSVAQSTLVFSGIVCDVSDDVCRPHKVKESITSGCEHTNDRYNATSKRTAPRLQEIKINA